MREIIIYSIAALTALWIMGYSIHMLIGGLVSVNSERLIIAISCLLGAGVIGFMTYDVIKHRKKQ